ncbi:MAG: TOBE domain-containing protein, partial [Candidatus Bathyarchaeota archaeon]|nr:TOBE domain-containing protein [Candidatus Bathyarchaeota archaeon]
VIEPELLLLDEPTANLDPRNTSIIEEILSHTNREKRTTIIMTTHNLLQAENLAQRVAFLNEGRIEAIGSFQEVFGKPAKHIESFARLENVFYGFSKATDEGTSIVDVGGGLRIEVAARRVGNVMLHVPPEDIILSTHPIISSARNMFEGRIMQISDMDYALKLKVSVGVKNFVVQVTKRSFNEMNLGVGSKVYIAFKASSVQII